MKQLLSIFFSAVFGLAFLASCEDRYFPKLEEMPQLLVVESHLTNDSRQNYVRISASNGFYENNYGEALPGLTVSLIQEDGKSQKAIDRGNGYYSFLEAPVSGNSYKLRINHLKDVYESDMVVMPALPSIDSIYTQYKVSKTYRTDEFGPPVLIETPSREIYVDVPVNAAIQYYRFKWRAVLLWCITPPPTPLGYPASTYGWNSLIDNDRINLAGEKRFSESPQIKKHPILSLPYDYRIYIDSEEKLENGWIIILDQYGTEKKAYEFYEELNKQFTAENNLFDPVLTQINGNMHCLNDPSKKILGFFEINSYRQYRYYFNIWSIDQGKVLLRELKRFPDIPGEGQTLRTPPEFWEYTY